MGAGRYGISLPVFNWFNLIPHEPPVANELNTTGEIPYLQAAMHYSDFDTLIKQLFVQSQTN